MSEMPLSRFNSFVGQTKRTQRDDGTQLGGSNEPKRPKASGTKAFMIESDAVEVQLTSDDHRSHHFNSEGVVSDVRHTRQLDTVYSSSRKRRINLPVGSKLALRFPHLVQQVEDPPNSVSAPTKRVQTAHAKVESNKRRRQLPFKTKSSQIGQCADLGIE